MRTLWIIAFSLSVAGLAACFGLDVGQLLVALWLFVFGLASVIGAVAAGVSTVRLPLRLLGILIPLLSIPLLFAVSVGVYEPSWQPWFLSVTQIVLLWGARYATKSHPKDAPKWGAGEISK